MVAMGLLDSHLSLGPGEKPVFEAVAVAAASFEVASSSSSGLVGGVRGAVAAVVSEAVAVGVVGVVVAPVVVAAAVFAPVSAVTVAGVAAGISVRRSVFAHVLAVAGVVVAERRGFVAVEVVVAFGAVGWLAKTGGPAWAGLGKASQCFIAGSASAMARQTPRLGVATGGRADGRTSPGHVHEVRQEWDPRMHSNLQAPLKGWPDARSEAQPEEKERIQRICRAEWALENALHNRVPEEYPKNITEARNHHRELLHLQRIYNIAILSLVVLTLVEVPPWCHDYATDKDLWTFRPGAEWCRSPGLSDSEVIYLSNVWYLPPGYALIAELLIESVIFYKWSKMLQLEDLHFHPVGVEWNSRRCINFGRLFAVCSIIDTLVFCVCRNSFRFTWLFRSGLLFIMPSVQQMCWSIFNPRVLGEFCSVAVFLLGAFVFFAWIAVTLFMKADTLAYQEGEEQVLANKGMESFPTALYTMFVAGASGDFIDCFLPSYTMFRASGLLWMIYLMLTQVLLKNLVMDTLVTAFVRGSEKEIEDKTTVLARGVLKAFDTLSDGKETVAGQDFEDFVKELQKSPLSEKIDDRIVHRMSEHYNPITREKFCDICEVLSNRYTIAKRDSSCQPPEWLSRRVWGDQEDWNPPENPAFDQFMNKVLLVNLGLVVWESYYNLCDGLNEPAWMDYLDLIFSFVYLGEVAVKLSVKAFQEYWMDSANQFVGGLLDHVAAALHEPAAVRLPVRALRPLQVREHPSVAAPGAHPQAVEVVRQRPADDEGRLPQHRDGKRYPLPYGRVHVLLLGALCQSLRWAHLPGQPQAGGD
ncbi:unnamed protein product [Prorocentrum cordatum]|uniref:Ion transport domain-containing protein n=1 Tax=Prorocentrum cordatum TaxID=2364126 RepID=A0ABN9VXV1_9DINO|nr:unnamed protein product [Polarella glacialis]